MLLQDAVNNRQTDARTLEFLFAVQTLEDLEKFVGILHVKPNSAITNEYHRRALDENLSNLNDGSFPPTRELQCVGEQIEKCLLDESAIALRR